MASLRIFIEAHAYVFETLKYCHKQALNQRLDELLRSDILSIQGGALSGSKSFHTLRILQKLNSSTISITMSLSHSLVSP